MKIIKYLIIFLCTSISASAQAENSKNLFIYMKTGNVIAVSTTDSPKISFDDGIMTIGNEQFNLGNVSKYTIGNEVDKVSVILHDELKIDTRHVGEGYVTISNCNAKEVGMFDLSGKPIQFSISQETDSSFTIDFNEQSTGTYLLNIGTETIKLFKK